jgi:hypothetical protein
MAESIATVVNWYGPYTGASGGAVLAAQAAAKAHYRRGLYMAVGHGETIRRGPRKLLYCGISDDLGARVSPAHSKLASLSVTGIWLGEISSTGIPGRRAKRTNPNLDIVEWMSVFFLRIPHNDRKKTNPPTLSAVVLNRWWETDYHTPTSRPAPRWADVIEWDSFRQTANLCWFGHAGRVLALDREGKKISATQ